MTDKYILISGAYSEIGQALVNSLADQQCNLLIIGRDKEKLNFLQNKYPQANIKAFDLDVTDDSQVEFLFHTLKSQSIKLISAVCLVGGHQLKPLKIARKNDYMKLFEVNVISATNLISRMRNFILPGGSIVLVSSAAVTRAGGLVSTYTTSKIALIGYARSAALEFSDINVRVNVICPGVVKTAASKIFLDKIGEVAVTRIVKQHPLGLGEASDVSNLVEFLMSEKSRWITGQSIYIDGGFSIS